MEIPPERLLAIIGRQTVEIDILKGQLRDALEEAARQRQPIVESMAADARAVRAAVEEAQSDGG